VSLDEPGVRLGINTIQPCGVLVSVTSLMLLSAINIFVMEAVSLTEKSDSLSFNVL